MNNRLIAYIFAGLLACSVIAADAADPREKLGTIIPHGIALLEKGDHKTFIQTFVSPDDLKKVLERSSLDEFVLEFGKEKAAVLLAVLKSIQGSHPRIWGDGKRATFDIPENISSSRRLISFSLIGQHWFIN